MAQSQVIKNLHKVLGKKSIQKVAGVDQLSETQVICRNLHSGNIQK